MRTRQPVVVGKWKMEGAGACAGCRSVRDWLSEHFDPDSAQCIRILCGGSVSPAAARGLLSLHGVDGLGAGRKGRSPDAHAGIVRLIAEAHARSG